MQYIYLNLTTWPIAHTRTKQTDREVLSVKTADMFPVARCNLWPILQTRRQDKHQVVKAYIDFSEAFDVASQNKLFVRLQLYDIQLSYFITVVAKNFFTGRTQRTMVRAVIQFCSVESFRAVF